MGSNGAGGKGGGGGEVGGGGGGGVGMFKRFFCLFGFLCVLFCFVFIVFDGKSVMSMFCNVMMLLLLYVHVCVTRTGWKTRPWPKTVILSIKKSNQIKSLSLSLSFSLARAL